MLRGVRKSVNELTGAPANAGDSLAVAANRGLFP